MNTKSWSNESLLKAADHRRPVGSGMVSCSFIYHNICHAFSWTVSASVINNMFTISVTSSELRLAISFGRQLNYKSEDMGLIHGLAKTCVRSGNEILSLAILPPTSDSSWAVVSGISVLTYDW